MVGQRRFWMRTAAVARLEFVIRRVSRNLGVYEGQAPPESASLESEGFAVLRGVFAAAEVRRCGPRSTRCSPGSPERSRGDRDEFRYEMLNRSAACQGRGRAPADPRGDRAAARRGLPRDREHRVAQSAGVQGRPVALRRRAPRAAARRASRGTTASRTPCSRSPRTCMLRGLRRGRRADHGRARQPPLRAARAVRRRPTRPQLRRPTAGARHRRRRRRRAVRLGRVAPRLPARRAAAAGSSSRCTTAGATSRSGSARPTWRTSSRRRRSPARPTSGHARSSACTTRSSTTAEPISW